MNQSARRTSPLGATDAPLPGTRRVVLPEDLCVFGLVASTKTAPSSLVWLDTMTSGEKHG